MLVCLGGSAVAKESGSSKDEAYRRALVQQLQQQAPEEGANYTQQAPALSPEQLAAMTQQYRLDAAQRRGLAAQDPYWSGDRQPPVAMPQPQNVPAWAR